MNCIKCGKYIHPQSLEGAEYIKDVKGKWWCVKCVKATLATAQMYEEMADEPMRYREGLIHVLTDYITKPDEDGNIRCMKPRERCEASAEKCLKCWLEYLVGEMEG